MKPFLPILFLFISYFPGLAQENSTNTIKHIQGDTSHYYDWISKHARKIKMENIYKTNKQFYFRIWDLGEAVEIWSDSSNVLNGMITNYIYQKSSRKNIPGDTLFSKTMLTNKQAKFVYDLIDSYGILLLPTGSKIKGWEGRVTDGNTFIIELANKGNYFIKTYNTPSAFDSIPEAKLFQRFIDTLSDTLNIENLRNKFERELPNRNYYSYTYGSNMGIQCMSSFINLEYNFNSKLPFGYVFSYFQFFLNKTKINASLTVEYNTDFNGSSDLSLCVNKYEIIDIDTGKYSLSANIGWRYRDLAFIDKKNQFKNYNFYIRNYFSKLFIVSIGFDYLQDNNTGKTGAILGLSKSFKKPKIYLYAQSYIYQHQLDYSFGISRQLIIKRPRYFYTWLSLYFESFYDYNSLNLTIYIPLHQ